MLALLLGGGAIGAAWWLQPKVGPAFRPYFGALAPVRATTIVVICGGLALGVLQARGWLVLHRPSGEWRGLRRAAVWAPLLALPVVIVDLLGGFPRDINVPVPQALLFYPLMAVIAEGVFHAVPLALLLPLLRALAPRLSRERVLWIGLFVVALIEPGLQMGWGAGGSPAWANAYVGLHVLVINGLLLTLVKRHGFLTAYLFRVLYYLCWHILWGTLRLPLLFGPGG